MKKKSSRSGNDDLRPEYDLRSLRLVAVGPGRKVAKRIRRKSASARYAPGANVVVLDPDVAAEFSTPKDVNDALRAVAEIIRQRTRRTNRKSA